MCVSFAVEYFKETPLRTYFCHSDLKWSLFYVLEAHGLKDSVGCQKRQTFRSIHISRGALRSCQNRSLININDLILDIDRTLGKNRHNTLTYSGKHSPVQLNAVLKYTDSKSAVCIS